jgi:hypothetical protein
VKEQHLQQFLNKIEPFRELWRSVRFVCYAGKIGTAWTLLGGRMHLSPQDVSSQSLQKPADFDTFFAFVNDFSIESFRQVLQEIVETDNIHLNLGGGTLFRDIQLSMGDGQNYVGWFNSSKFDRTGGNFFEMGPVGFSWGFRSQRQISTLPEAVRCLEKASEQLRRDTPIDGVEALVRQLSPGLIMNFYSCPELQIVAPLPFGLDPTHGGGVRLTIPTTVQHGSVSLKAFFYPEGHSPAERFVGRTENSDKNEWVQIDWEPKWPDNATHANIRLFWGAHHIDSLTINRWDASASILGAVGEYFDPGHKRLSSALKYRDKQSSDPFELAVVRILNILGIPATWYGNTVADRADAVAIIRSDKSTVLLLVECTREKPMAKLSTLAERGNHLREYLHVKAEVLPVVFTAARIVESEIRAAMEYGVGLIGSDEIDQLVKLIAAPDTTVDKVLQKLRPRQTITDLVLRTAGQLTGLD